VKLLLVKVPCSSPLVGPNTFDAKFRLTRTGQIGYFSRESAAFYIIACDTHHGWSRGTKFFSRKSSMLDNSFKYPTLEAYSANASWFNFFTAPRRTKSAVKGNHLSRRVFNTTLWELTLRDWYILKVSRALQILIVRRHFIPLLVTRHEHRISIFFFDSNGALRRSHAESRIIKAAAQYWININKNGMRLLAVVEDFSIRGCL